MKIGAIFNNIISPKLTGNKQIHYVGEIDGTIGSVYFLYSTSLQRYLFHVILYMYFYYFLIDSFTNGISPSPYIMELT